jgi:sec-independent protein translocase protein TatA
MPGTTEMLIIALVVIVLFGSTKLPKLARSIGQASTEFKKGVKQGADDEPTADTAPAPAPAPASNTDSPEQTAQ